MVLAVVVEADLERGVVVVDLEREVRVVVVVVFGYVYFPVCYMH